MKLLFADVTLTFQIIAVPLIFLVWGATTCCFQVADGLLQIIIPVATRTTTSSRRIRHDDTSSNLNLAISSSSRSRLWASSLSSSSSSSSEQTNYHFGAIPVKEGTVAVTRGEKEKEEQFNLSYNLVRPMSLSSQQAAPIVVLHGGPSLPSDYCYPLAKHVPYRSILFYDQLGCGKSDEPSGANNYLEYYSIEQAVDDLEVMLDRLSIRRFHLYGHSYGGILAYEYQKRCAEKGNHNDSNNNNNNNNKCLSVILSSAPTNIQQMEDDWDTMTEALSNPDLFRETHLCRTPEMPQPLQDAYAKAGTVWSGTAAISDYKAQPPQSKDDDDDDDNENNTKTYMPSALILRGEYDVVTESCSKGWKENILLRSRSVRERTLPDCSHHGLLENGSMYGGVVDSYFGEYD